MLRNIVGWRRIENEPWQETMFRMKYRVNRALDLFPIKAWSIELLTRQFRCAMRISNDLSSWPYLCKNWEPMSTNLNAYRPPGRPRLRWDDKLSSFSSYRYNDASWHDVYRNCHDAHALEEAFLSYHAS